MATRKRNRLQLLLMKRRLSFVKQGVRILTDKRDALMKEFHGMIDEVREKRAVLDEDMDRAVKTLRIAKGTEPHEGLVSAALASQRHVHFPITFRKVWGVKMPETDFTYEKRDFASRGSLPGYRSPAVDVAAEEFEKVIESLLESAVKEDRLKRVGSAVRSTSRRLNALEEKVQPEVEKDINDIKSYLEEAFREEVFRMKRYKSLQERKAAESGGEGD